jgi:plasmid stability protein
MNADGGEVWEAAAARSGVALMLRWDGWMATIRIRNLPDDVVAVYRRRAAAAGRSLESYLREQLITMARRRDKAEAMAIAEQALAEDLHWD